MITVYCFASIRETLGVSERQLPAPVPPITAAEILARITGPQTLPAAPLVAINLQHASLDSVVHDGDEIAFFPPVSGG